MLEPNTPIQCGSTFPQVLNTLMELAPHHHTDQLSLSKAFTCRGAMRLNL